MPGTISRKTSSRLALSSGAMMVRPVVLPPGCDNEATNPAPRISSLIATMGMVLVACWAILGASITGRKQDVRLQADELCGQCGQLLQAASRIAEFNADVLTFDVAQLAKRLPKTISIRGGAGGSAPGHKTPTMGIADVCARTASGHAAAAPPKRPINSRRLMLVPRAHDRTWYRLKPSFS